jgi:hypothetical protein
MSLGKQPIFATKTTGQVETITGATSISAWVENDGEGFTVTAGFVNGESGALNQMTFTNKVGYNPTFMGAQQMVDHVFDNITGTLRIVYFK